MIPRTSQKDLKDFFLKLPQLPVRSCLKKCKKVLRNFPQTPNPQNPTPNPLKSQISQPPHFLLYNS